MAANRLAVFRLGFRPFFLGAALLSVAATLAWMGLLLFGLPARPFRFPPVTWHAHEMVFGYTAAVVAGFLLTAVRNWTGLPTPTGLPLALLFFLWVAGRLLPFLPEVVPIEVVAVVDNLFLLLLFIAIAAPILKAKLWRNIGVASVVLLLLASHVVFYLGAAGVLAEGVRWGIYAAVYLVLALIFVMGRRVIPSFIERGVDEAVKLVNRQWLDIASLATFVLFVIADVFLLAPILAAVLAAVLFVMHTIRLAGWHSPGIWRKPLLWVLYVGYGFLALGFLLKAAAPVAGIRPALALHAFTFGGIGIMTLGMMARVALGHTGRSIHDPPALLPWAFLLLAAGAVARVIVPLLAPAQYIYWIGLSQVFWILAFAVFLVIYIPILSRPRVDGKPG